MSVLEINLDLGPGCEFLIKEYFVGYKIFYPIFYYFKVLNFGEIVFILQMFQNKTLIVISHIRVARSFHIKGQHFFLIFA